jgi:hypothetical protein
MTRREWTIGLPIVVLLTLCLVAYLRGMALGNDASALTSLRVFGPPDGQKVAAVIGSRLHVLDADGQRLADQDMRALGFSEDPNDMDWTVDAQGRTEAWFFEDTLPRVVRCAWSDAQARLENCAIAIAGAKLKVNAASRAVHLAVDRPGERVFVTDAKGGAVQIFDFSGKRLAKSDASEVALDFPNRIRYLGDNTLLVGDNDNGRVVWLAAEPGKPIRLLKTLYAQDHGDARLAHTKVTDAAISPTGTLWMLAMRFGQADGDILVFDADHRPVRRAALRGDADPVIVEPLGDALLVGDFSPPRLYRVDAQGRPLDDFGDAAFRADLLPLQAQAEHASLWMRAAAVGAVVTFVVGSLLAWRFSERPAPRGRIDVAARAGIERARAVAAPLRFPIVIERSPEYLKQERRLLWGMVASMVALFGGVAWILIANGKHIDLSKVSWQFWLQAVGMAALPPIAIAWTYWFGGRRSLQVTVDTVRWRSGERTLAEAPLHAVLASGNALLIGTRMLLLRQRTRARKPGTPMFDAALIEQSILARLPRENLVDDAALTREMLERNVYLKALIVAAIVGAILVITHSLYRALG